MAFIPPVFQILKANTLNLSAVYSRLIGRYLISPELTEGSSSSTSSSAPLSTPFSRLKTLIARTNKVISCTETTRVTQRKVFSQLVLELSQIPETDIKQVKQATQYLLGALIHRYFRIIKECDDWNYYIYKQHPLDSDLFRAIRETLNLEQGDRNTYQALDLKKLDVMTIVSSLRVFKQNMMAPNIKGVPHYMEYEHFAKKDPNFIENLDKMIHQHCHRDKQNAVNGPVLNQFMAINFIQSLVEEVSNKHEKIVQALKQWAPMLQKKHSSFSGLTVEVIEEHIESAGIDQCTKNVILDLLYTQHITSNMKHFDHTTFIEALIKCDADIASYTVLGGYVLLLKSRVTTEQMKFCIEEALMGKRADITASDMLNAVVYLKEFTETYPVLNLDCQFFGDQEALKTRILQEQLQLNQKITDEKQESGNLIKV